MLIVEVFRVESKGAPKSGKMPGWPPFDNRRQTAMITTQVVGPNRVMRRILRLS